MNENAYIVLGLSRDATTNEITDKYKTLCEKFHPNSMSSQIDSEKFTLINKAYKILKDPDKRQAYDIIISEIGDTHNKMVEEFNKYIASEESSRPMTEDDRKWLGTTNVGSIKGDISKEKLIDLETQRDNDNIESKPEKIFGNDDFSLDLFNKLFDTYVCKKKLDGTIDTRFTSENSFGEIYDVKVDTPEKSLRETLDSIRKYQLETNDDSNNSTELDTNINNKLDELIHRREDYIKPIDQMEYKLYPRYLGKGETKLDLDKYESLMSR